MEIPAQTIDGNDVWAVREAAAEALERARSGGGPSFVEALTYRFVGHSRSDPAKYRPEGELDSWRERDPLKITRERLGAEGVSEETLAETEASVAEELEAVGEAAVAAPFPEPDPTATEFKA
jgi:TPP-dependent pyruvate/acetoin dehydrogenase alpha subunit